MDPENVTLDDRRLAVVLPDARVTVSLSKSVRSRLALKCSACSAPCEHVGTVISLILEDKTFLGLAVPPDDSVPLEHLTEDQLIERMLDERQQRARDEKMVLKPLTPGVLWSDSLVTNPASGKTYRVALRGWERGEAYCTCPDFRTNTLGTCKHIVFALEKARKRFPAAVRNNPYCRTGISVHLHYGTPLENRLDELFSVAQFIDDRRLGPAFHFFHRHRVVDERGKVLGYKNMDDLRRRLAPMLLRRTRQGVLGQLPPRMTEIVRVTPTEEQAVLHGEHMRVVSSIVRKKYITEMDLLRLQKALLMCRMAADSTYLVTKEVPAYSSKLDRPRPSHGTETARPGVRSGQRRHHRRELTCHVVR